MASDASGPPSEVSPGSILELLRSGRRAPNISVSDICNRVSALEARSQQLKDEISRLALLITQKEEEIASTETEILQTKSLLAPIRSIPPEILLRSWVEVCPPRRPRALSVMCVNLGGRYHGPPHLCGPTSTSLLMDASACFTLTTFSTSILSSPTHVPLTSQLTSCRWAKAIAATWRIPC